MGKIPIIVPTILTIHVEFVLAQHANETPRIYIHPKRNGVDKKVGENLIIFLATRCTL